MGWDDDDWSFYEGPEKEQLRDDAIDSAKEELESFFNQPQHRENVYYVMQLQVIFEKTFFHWITYKAIEEPIEEEKLDDEVETLVGRTFVRFVFHPRLRSKRRQIKKKIALIRKFSVEDVSRACGRYAEILFLNNLLKSKFVFCGKTQKSTTAVCGLGQATISISSWSVTGRLTAAK